MEHSESVVQEAVSLQNAGSWREALELLDTLEPPLSFRAHNLRGRSLWRLSRMQEAESAFNESLLVAQMENDRNHLAMAHLSLGATRFEQSRFLEAAESLQKSIAHFDNEECTGLANALNWLAQTYHHIDLYDMAADTFARGLEVSVNIGSLEIEAYIRSNSGLMQMTMGDNAAAESSFRMALDLNRRIENRYGIADTLSNIGIALHADQRYVEAEPWLREGMEAHAELGVPRKEIMVGLYLADVLRVSGRQDEALELVRKCVERIDDNLTSFMRVQICALAFEQFKELGMLQEAAGVLDNLDQFLDGHETSLSNHVKLHRLKAGMAHARKDVDGVHEHLLKALQLQNEVSRKQNALLASFLSMHEQVVRSRMEAKLAKAQKYESLGILTAGIAHDFNNSLHAILGYAEGITGDDAVAGKVESIRSAVSDSADLCQQMLAFAGHASMNPEILDLNRTILDVVPFIIPMAGGVDLRWEPGEGLPPVEVDPVQLKYWVISLLINSMEALDGCGEITVSTGLIAGGTADMKDRPCIRIIDNGPGIPVERLDRLFDPFFSTKKTSRGMGLSVIKGSVESIGGEITVRSEPGVTTEFTIILPPAPVVESTKSPAPAEVEPGGRTVALVDDDEKIREVTGSMLMTLGYRVTRWSDGNAFLDGISSSGCPDCVLLDMTMPGCTGSEVFVRMREMGFTTPVILMSGFSSRESMAHFKDEMPVCFLQKPFSVLQMKNALNLALGSDAKP
jgi:signal transduction histidine kinase/Tfp pilus assembly protein PilF/ActR/RegA family two-component response regulator